MKVVLHFEFENLTFCKTIVTLWIWHYGTCITFLVWEFDFMEVALQYGFKNLTFLEVLLHFGYENSTFFKVILHFGFESLTFCQSFYILGLRIWLFKVILHFGYENSTFGIHVIPQDWEFEIFLIHVTLWVWEFDLFSKSHVTLRENS